MQTVHVIQNDDPQRSISVQPVRNPMSINDLMVTQRTSPVVQRTRQLSAEPLRAAPASVPPVRFTDQPAGAAPAPPARRRSRRSRPPPTDDFDMGDMGDGGGGGGDLGLDLLANPRKKKKDDVHNTRKPRARDAADDDELWGDDDAGGGGDGIDDFVDPRERAQFERDFDDGPSLPPPSPHGSLSTPRRFSPGGMPPDFGGVADMDAGGAGPFMDVQPQPMDYADPYKPQPSPEEILERKQKILEGLDKFARRGIPVKRFDIHSPLEEMEAEYNRRKREVDLEKSIQFSRKMLMACVTGLEYLNSRFDPLGLQLDGWSESVIEDIHNYDDVFERLYDKYHTSVEMAPEFELLLMVGGSAFMFHLTNSMFKSHMPGMGAANPEMMRNVRRGVMGAMSGMMGSGRAASRPPSSPPRKSTPMPRPGGPPMGARGARGSAPRREMRGPSSNVDDLLNNLMDREPAEISERLVEEIDDILNQSDDDAGGAPARNISISAGSASLPPGPSAIEI